MQLRTQEDATDSNLDVLNPATKTDNQKRQNQQRNDDYSFGGRRNRQSEVSKRDSAGPVDVARPRSFSTMVESRTENLRTVAKEMQGQALRRLSVKMQQLEKQIEEKSCRICFCGEEEIKQAKGNDRNKQKEANLPKLTNPLLAPCQCTGSSRYIHLECL